MPSRTRRRPQISQIVEFYEGLSPEARVAVWVLLALEAVLIVAAQRDIQRRSADSIRGPKLLWRIIATQNIVGPAAYFALGRKPPPGTKPQAGVDTR
jgi:hypothetical protein